MVGLVTRCVLLLLYGGLLHHQNIKCPVEKRACAWVHPHFTFTADCRLNRATFPRFLAPENVPRTAISNPLFLSLQMRSLIPPCCFFYIFPLSSCPLWYREFYSATSWLISERSPFIGSPLLCGHFHLKIASTTRQSIYINRLTVIKKLFKYLN